MSQDRFYNYYIETLNSTLQDAIGKNIVFQTQARIAKEDQEQLNASINELLEKLNEYQNIEDSISSQKEILKQKDMEIQNLIRERDHARNEASHIDTFRSELVSARQELQHKNLEIQNVNVAHEKEIANVRSECNRKISDIKSNSDKILRDFELKTQNQIKELNEKIEYYEMSPAQKRKFNSMKNNNNENIILEQNSPELSIEIIDDEGSDGGTF